MDKSRAKISAVEYLAQPIDKARFGREIPRKSKETQPSKSLILAAKRPRPRKSKRVDRTGVAATNG
jgi:hypothetical protein